MISDTIATIASVLRSADETLAHLESGALDARLLLAEVMDMSRTGLYTWPEKQLAPEQLARFSALIAQRAQHYPVAYLLGRQEFWSLPFIVGPDVLIPRPETELLVEKTLLYMESRLPTVSRVLDLGTGSGAIACSLAKACPQARVTAVDASAPALLVAKSNAEALGVHNVELVLSDWFAEIEGHFDVIVSNPPYIEAGDEHLLRGDVQYEPVSALVAGRQGMDDIDRICQQASSHLSPDGLLILEHGWNQGELVRACFHKHGFIQMETFQDLAGHDRVTKGRYSG